MGTLGPHPETGLRIELRRATDAPPWIYEGHAVTPTARFAVRATDGGEVTVEAGAPENAAEIVRGVVRVACKESPPPRRIVRWRGEK